MALLTGEDTCIDTYVFSLPIVYKFQDFVNALKNLNGSEGGVFFRPSSSVFGFPFFQVSLPRERSPFQMWLGEKCGSRAKKQALVNIAAFLGQAMRETIIYDACK